MGTEVKTLYGYFAPNSERILGPVSLNRLHLVSEIKQDSSAKLRGLNGAACSSHTGEAKSLEVVINGLNLQLFKIWPKRQKSLGYPWGLAMHNHLGRAGDLRGVSCWLVCAQDLHVPRRSQGSLGMESLDKNPELHMYLLWTASPGLHLIISSVEKKEICFD